MVIAAHYDGQGLHPTGAVYSGADDNASGVAALLEVARVAQKRSTGRPIELVFVAFGAEEVGQLGARRYLANPTTALSRVSWAINLDMVGRPLPQPPHHGIGFLTLGEGGAATAHRLQHSARQAELEILGLEDLGNLRPQRSDAEVLSQRLPTLLLSTALHGDHHQLTDTTDRIDYGQIERAARLVLALLARVEQDATGNRDPVAESGGLSSAGTSGILSPDP